MLDHPAQQTGTQTARGDSNPGPDAGSYWFFGTLATIKLSGERTEGRLSIVETLAPPGSAPPLHVHRVDDEIFCVVDGELTLYVGDRTIPCRPGSVALAPKGIPHVYVVAQERPARILTVSAPAMFDRLVEALGEPTKELTLPPPPKEPPDLADITPVVSEFGIEILGPPGTFSVPIVRTGAPAT